MTKAKMLEVSDEGFVRVIVIHRPEIRNAIDALTAARLREEFTRFNADDNLRALVLTGAGDHFCAGADLKAVAAQELTHDPLGAGPLGPTRDFFDKPTIAAVEGYAVAGGLELALMCDLRVASKSAVFGVHCRRWGVPLIDGGTVRLPRLIGQSRALDMILTGRPVAAEEALAFGLANRVVEQGQALSAAIALANELAAFPQECLRSDRRSAIDQWSLDFSNALRHEAALGETTLKYAREGVSRYVSGEGRHGVFG